jgi:hypothetical protein
MRRFILLSIAFTCLFCSPELSLADPGDNCQTNLTDKVSDTEDWRKVFVLEGDDGYAWRRALVQTAQIRLRENSTIRINGIAEPMSPVQVYVFARKDNDEDLTSNGIKKPDSGVCWEGTTADEYGQFHLDLKAQMMWGGLGSKIVLDAFYRMELTWDEYLDQRSDTNQNIGIGSHFPPRVIDLLAGEEPGAECNKICTTGLVTGVVLDPKNLSSKLMGKNFDSVGSTTVTVGRFPGPHTFFTKANGNAEADRDELQSLTHKALGMEVLKRALLGDQGYGGSSPGIEELSVAQLENAYIGHNEISIANMLLVRNIRAALISTGDDYIVFDTLNKKFAVANKILTNIKKRFTPLNISKKRISMNSVKILQNPDPFSNLPPPPTPEMPSRPYIHSLRKSISNVTSPSGPPTKMPPPPPSEITREEALHYLNTYINNTGNTELIEDLFPEGSSEVSTWAADFLRMMYFWTGTLEINECLMVNNQAIQNNFVDIQFAEELRQCGYPYVSGLTPTLLLHTKKPIILKPVFEGVNIISSEILFDTKEEWHLPAGKKKPLAYKYTFTETFPINYSSTACLQKNDIYAYANYLTEQLSLSPSEKNIIKTELKHAITDQNTFYQIKIANPETIAKHFRWQGNENPLNIFQLFFNAQEKKCSERNFGNIKITAPINRDGFEAGIL